MSRARQVAVEVVARLQEAGHTAYFAGGCVRDELLGLHPDDYDVATDAPPERVRSLFPRVNEVGASFGVMLVRRKGATVEVATFRSEGVYSDRRRPDRVEFADAQADARRRDFTINALFLDPLANPNQVFADDPAAPVRLTPPQGGVIDFVGGLADLGRGIVRAVGDPDARLEEDHLRGLRAVRIAARLGFAIEEATSQAIRRHARELAGVSRERVGDEIRRMLAPASRARAIALIETLLLALPTLGGEVGADEPTPIPTVEALDAAADAMTVLAAWALDRVEAAVGRQQRASEARIEAIARQLRAALCLSNDERDALACTLRTLAAIQAAWGRMGAAERKRLAASQRFEQAIFLLRAREAASAARVESDVAALARTPSGLTPQPLVDGEDVAILAGGPGPVVGRVLRRVYDAQLEDAVATREAALELARRLIEEDRGS